MAASGVTCCFAAAGAQAAGTSPIGVLPCSSTPVTLGRAVSVGCEPATPSGPTVTSHVATVSLARGAQLGVVSAHHRVWQYKPDVDSIPDEPTSRMLPGKAALAVNGGFFDINLGNGAPYSGQACGGMVIGGRIVKTPPVGGTDPSQLTVSRDGAVRIGAVGYRGIVADGSATTALTSVNDLSDAGPEPGCPPLLQHALSPGQGITMITPDMGAVNLPFTPANTPVGQRRDYRIPHAVVVRGTRTGATMTVTSIAHPALLTALPALTGQQVALVASAPRQTTWLTDHARVGRPLRVHGALLIDDTRRTDITTLLSGSAVLVHDGATCPSSGTTPPGCGGQLPPPGGHAETMIGVSRDGGSLQLIVVDDPGGKDGLEPGEDASFLAAHGAWNGLLLDGGGSSTMAARTAPGAAAVLVNNTDTGETEHPPGPGGQRYVANALAVFPAAAPRPTPGPTATSPHTSPTATGTPVATTTPTRAGASRSAQVLAATGPAAPTAVLAGAALVAMGAALQLGARGPRRYRPTRTAGRRRH